MREYKFRGKQLEDIKETETRYGSKKGKWRYGSYLYAHKYRHGEHAHLICNIYGEECIMCDKETIGQYTGLKDKNGIEIYEGDTIQFQTFIKKREVYWDEYFGTWAIDLSKSPMHDGRRFLYEVADDIKVIGNIHAYKRGYA